jgi:hypothetical protein
MKLYRSIVTVSGFTAISRVLGFIRDMLIAAVLGAGPASIRAGVEDLAFVNGKATAGWNARLAKSNRQAAPEPRSPSCNRASSRPSRSMCFSAWPSGRRN